VTPTEQPLQQTVSPVIDNAIVQKRTVSRPTKLTEKLGSRTN
jgi:hypothetical protein